MANENVLNYYLDQFDISSPFGEDRGSYTHKGVDFNLAGEKDSGMSILSVDAGEVVKEGYGSDTGNFITIRNSDGTESTYMHMLNSTSLGIGTKVAAGQQIGQIGSTGDSSGSHLHLQMKDSSGNFIDPVKWLQGKTITAVGAVSDSVSGVADGLIERFKNFSFSFILWIVGLLLLLYTLYAMFLQSKTIIRKVKPNE